MYRVVHLGKYYHPHAGGIESHVRTLAAAQAAAGAEVHVVCLAHEDSTDDEFWDGAVFVRRFQPRLRLAKFEWTPDVVGYLHDLNCDIVHVHVPNPMMTMAALKWRTQAPLVITYHSEIVGMSLRHRLFQPWEHRLFARARFIAATNPRVVEASECLAGHRSQVRVIPLGIDLEPFERPGVEVERRAMQLRREHRGPVWLMCGRLVPYKGHAVALEALTQVAGTLVIIGDGPLRAELQRESERLQISDRVRFLGHVPDNDDVIAWYRAATALWLPSILPSEAFGLVQVEAMASGCPVINTDIPASGVPWVSRHNQTGFTIPVGDASALAKAAQRLHEDTFLRARFVRNGRVRASAEFGHNVMAERWNELYEQALAGQEDRQFNSIVRRALPATSSSFN